MDRGRIILIGDSGVGKTSIMGYASQDECSEFTKPTIGVSVTSLKVTVDGEEVQLYLWDTAGQEMYRSIVPLYFKGAALAIAVFSVDNPKSFCSLNDWIAQLNACTQARVPIVIVANKCDLLKDSAENKVDMDQALEWAHTNGFPIFRTSAKTGFGINDLVTFVAKSYAGTAGDGKNLTMASRSNGCC